MVVVGVVIAIIIKSGNSSNRGSNGSSSNTIRSHSTESSNSSNCSLVTVVAVVVIVVRAFRGLGKVYLSHHLSTSNSGPPDFRQPLHSCAVITLSQVLKTKDKTASQAHTPPCF